MQIVFVIMIKSLRLEPLQQHLGLGSFIVDTPIFLNLGFLGPKHFLLLFRVLLFWPELPVDRGCTLDPTLPHLSFLRASFSIWRCFKRSSKSSPRIFASYSYKSLSRRAATLRKLCLPKRVPIERWKEHSTC